MVQHGSGLLKNETTSCRPQGYMQRKVLFLLVGLGSALDSFSLGPSSSILSRRLPVESTLGVALPEEAVRESVLHQPRMPRPQSCVTVNCPALLCVSVLEEQPLNFFFFFWKLCHFFLQPPYPLLPVVPFGQNVPN